MFGQEILTGIETMFFWLGVFSLASVQALVWLRWKMQASWVSLGVLTAGAGTTLFAIAWAVSSVLEKEPQSASMSMIVMLLPGLIMLAVGGRLALNK